MEEEIEERGISFGDICRTIFSQKWLALAIALIITVVGTVGLYLTGKSDREYSVSFVLQLPGADDSPSTYRYPDGTPFYYTDVISEENLTAAKAAVGKDIDIDKLLKEGGISISRVANETETSSDNLEIYDLIYKVKVKSSYFKDDDTAREFMVALAELPINYIAEMDINYDYSISASRTALTYETQLNELESQVNSLQSIYSSFITLCGGDFVVALEGSAPKTLNQIKTETVDDYLNKGYFATLRREAYDNGYIKSSTDSRERDKYESDKKALEEQLKIANNTLTKLIELQQNSGTVIYADSIRAQIVEVEQLTIELEEHTQKYLNNFDGGVVSKQFATKVKKVEDEVIKLTEDIKSVAASVYKNVSKVNYVNSQIIEIDGGRGLVMSGGISLVAGVALALIVAYIVGWSKQKKPAKAKENTVEVPVYVQAQTAVTEDTTENEENKEDVEEDK